jgi:hypothetical protein
MVWDATEIPLPENKDLLAEKEPIYLIFYANE